MSDLDWPLTIDAKRPFNEFVEPSTEKKKSPKKANVASPTKDPLKKLIAAVEANKGFAAIVPLMGNVEYINAVADYGQELPPRTAFWAAANVGNTNVAKAFLARGADINQIPYIRGNKHNLHSPFVQGVIGGHMGFVEFMLEQSALDDFTVELTQAIKRSDVDVKNLTFAKYILTRPRKLAVDAVPIVDEVKNGNSTAVINWLASGHTPNLRSPDPEDRNRTLLMIAVENRRSLIFSVLVRRGADLYLKDADGNDVESIAEDLGDDNIRRMVLYYTNMSNYYPRLNQLIRIDKPFEQAIKELPIKIHEFDIPFFKTEYKRWKDDQ